MVKRDSISRIPLFASIDPASLETLSRLLMEARYPKNHYIFYEGDPPDWLYILKEGEVKIVKHSPDGRDTILRIISPGEIFGGVAVVENCPYPASAITMEPSVVLKMDKEASVAFFKDDKNLSLNLLLDLCERLREAHDAVQEMAVDRVEKRIAKIILKLADRLGVSDEEGLRLTVKLTRQELAEMVGSTVETTIRIMSRLRREGIVVSSGGRLLIKDLKALKEIADEYPEA